MKEIIMIGNKYKLFGTTTIFEIEDEDGEYWIIKVYIECQESDAVTGVRMSKQDLIDSITTKQLELI